MIVWKRVLKQGDWNSNFGDEDIFNCSLSCDLIKIGGFMGPDFDGP